jgi:hypothetical protein
MGTYTRTAPVVKLTLENGDELQCTTDHKWLHGSKEYKVAEVGMPLVKTFPWFSSPQPPSPEYKRGYIRGALDGDRTTGQALLSVQCSVFTDRFRMFAGEFFDLSCYSETLDGKTLYLTRLLGGQPTLRKLESWTPKTRDEWAGWLGGRYDAEGCNNSIGQDRDTNPAIYNLIKEGLTYFSFDFHLKQHEILIKGGRDELLRFLTITTPANPNKADKVMLRGQFKSNTQRVVSIEPLGEIEVVSLQTESGNYFADGYASKNCDYNIRARYAGHIDISGIYQYSLDIDPVVPVLKHQEVASSISETVKPRHDAVASQVIQQKSTRYPFSSGYLPYALISNSLVDSLDGQGTEVDDLSFKAVL